jgi:hypothetical protein
MTDVELARAVIRSLAQAILRGDDAGALRDAALRAMDWLATPPPSPDLTARLERAAAAGRAGAGVSIGHCPPPPDPAPTRPPLPPLRTVTEGHVPPRLMFNARQAVAWWSVLFLFVMVSIAAAGIAVALFLWRWR